MLENYIGATVSFSLDIWTYFMFKQNDLVNGYPFMPNPNIH